MAHGLRNYATGVTNILQDRRVVDGVVAGLGIPGTGIAFLTYY
jgi:hypothetical protein